MPPKATPNATINNAQLFAIYTEKLRSHNPQVYATFAAKLANWLSDDRAYYGDARPKVMHALLLSPTPSDLSTSSDNRNAYGTCHNILSLLFAHA